MSQYMRNYLIQFIAKIKILDLGHLLYAQSETNEIAFKYKNLPKYRAIP